MKWNMKWPAGKWNEIWHDHVEHEMKYEMALARNEMKYKMPS